MKKKLKPQFGKLSIILLVAIAVLIAADLVTKYLEVEYNWNAVIIPGVVEIKSGVRNNGIAFGIYLGSIPTLIITCVLLAVMIFGFIFIPNRLVLLKVAISLVIAGAIGNIVDRIAVGYVRDWFGLWMFGKLAYCNFADFWIVIGTILAAIDLLFLNEFSVFPLTKKAKAIQAAKQAEEDRKKAEAASDSAEPVSEREGEATSGVSEPAPAKEGEAASGDLENTDGDE